MLDRLPAFAAAFSGFLTPVIALTVAYIAYRQFDTARAKLNLDLFDKRLAVYERVRAAVAIVNTKGLVDHEADRLLLEAINASEFLFGKDVRGYLDTMWKRLSRMRVAQSQIENSGDEATRHKAIEAQSVLFNEITAFYENGADVFARYMRMDHSLHGRASRR